MAFDRRGYYYCSIRDGDRVRRVYLGRGPAAFFAALRIGERRSARRAQCLARQAEEARWEEATCRQRALDALGGILARAALLAAGYHQHDRGAWRKRRMHAKDVMHGETPDMGVAHIDGANPGTGCPPKDGTSQVDGTDAGDRDPPEAELRDLLARAGRGDRAVLPDLGRLLDARPTLWRHAGDVGRAALAAWVDLIAGGDLLARESLWRSLAALEARVAGPAPSPLERLLAERVVAGWLQASQADAAFAQLKGQTPSDGLVEMMQRRQERTQRSYLAAIKALATVRRLGVAASPAATAEAVGTEGPRARVCRPNRRRGDPIEVPEPRPRTGGFRPARVGGERAGKGQPAGREALVPKALRDRMNGLAVAEN